jgi:hypothetical protein
MYMYMKEQGYVRPEHEGLQDVKNSTVQICSVKYSRNKNPQIKWDKAKMNYKEEKRFTRCELHLAPPLVSEKK